jgi:hypothetical protein
MQKIRSTSAKAVLFIVIKRVDMASQTPSSCDKDGTGITGMLRPVTELEHPHLRELCRYD